MDVNKVPEGIHHLIPYAGIWGIGDDGDRDLKVENSSKEELEVLIQSIKSNDADILDNWLAGAEARITPYSNEYLTFTCYLMAYDYAKVLVRQSNIKINKSKTDVG